MLEGVTIDDFAGRVGERFRLDAGERALELVLEECARLGEPALERVPFSLLFRGPREPVLAQRIYPLVHDELGRFELFLVPVAQDDDGTRYEAVFT